MKVTFVVHIFEFLTPEFAEVKLTRKFNIFYLFSQLPINFVFLIYLGLTGAALTTFELLKARILAVYLLTGLAHDSRHAHNTNANRTNDTLYKLLLGVVLENYSLFIQSLIIRVFSFEFVLTIIK